MQTMNKIFMQFYEADRYAHAKNPHLRCFAVIMLDNAIELRLRAKADWEFATDQTTWYNGVRQHSHKVRKQVLRNTTELVRFARDRDWIDEDGLRTLKFAHEVRNVFYHEGRYEELDAELAIRLLYKFVRKYFPIWRTCMPMIAISPDDPIPIEDAVIDGGFSPLMIVPGDHWSDSMRQSKAVQDPEYWKAALDRLLTYAPTDDLRLLISKKLTELLDTTENCLDLILENPMDYNWVLSNRFCVCTPAFVQWIEQGQEIRNPMVALNMYMSVLGSEQKLLDIPDETERAVAFHKVLNGHTFVPDPLPRIRVNRMREEAEAVVEQSEEEAVAMFLRIENELSNVLPAIREFARDLDYYFEQESDRLRGK